MLVSNGRLASARSAIKDTAVGNGGFQCNISVGFCFFFLILFGKKKKSNWFPHSICFPLSLIFFPLSFSLPSLRPLFSPLTISLSHSRLSHRSNRILLGTRRQRGRGFSSLFVAIVFDSFPPEKHVSSPCPAHESDDFSLV